MLNNVLADIEKRLNKKGTYEVRTIAREVGVSCPTNSKKEKNISDIMSIAACETDPVPRSGRGAPPKSADYDQELVRDILECRKCYAALKGKEDGANTKFEVSDGTEELRCAGILDKNFLRVNGCLPCADDVFVGESFIKRFKLKDGDYIECDCMQTQSAPVMVDIKSICGYSTDVRRREFTSLTPVYPKKRIRIANSREDIAARAVDMFAPVGFGQRAVISAPANSCKTTLIKQIATGISLNEEVSVIIFIVSGSPEELTDLSRSAEFAKVFHTDFTAEREDNVKASELITQFCKSAVEFGEDVVLIVDGLSKLGTAAKRLLASAICAEEGGSLTVIATVSGEGEYSSEYSAELLDAANMRVTLLEGTEEAPAIDISKSYTLNCSLMQNGQEIKTADMLRKQYKQTGDLSPIIKLFKETENNTEIVDKNG